MIKYYKNKEFIMELSLLWKVLGYGYYVLNKYIYV